MELNVRAFVRHLRAANLAPTTIEVYGDAARQLTAFLAEAGAQGGGDVLAVLPGDHSASVARIAGEDLVAAVAHEGNLDLRPRQPR